MIIIKGIPGLSSQDVIELLAHRIPIDKIKTGHGGFEVDEETALWFLTTYQRAQSNMGTPTLTEATTVVYDVGAEFSVSGETVADAVVFDEDPDEEIPVPEPETRPELTPQPAPTPRRGRPPKNRKGAGDDGNL